MSLPPAGFTTDQPRTPQDLALEQLLERFGAGGAGVAVLVVPATESTPMGVAVAAAGVTPLEVSTVLRELAHGIADSALDRGDTR